MAEKILKPGQSESERRRTTPNWDSPKISIFRFAELAERPHLREYNRHTGQPEVVVDKHFNNRNGLPSANPDGTLKRDGAGKYAATWLRQPSQLNNGMTVAQAYMQIIKELSDRESQGVLNAEDKPLLDAMREWARRRTGS